MTAFYYGGTSFCETPPILKQRLSMERKVWVFYSPPSIWCTQVYVDILTGDVTLTYPPVAGNPAMNRTPCFAFLVVFLYGGDESL